MNLPALPPILEKKFDDIYGNEAKDAYIHDMKALAENPKKTMMVNDEGRIVNAGKGRLIWENIKGAFGGVNHTKKALVEYRVMQLMKYGSDKNWIHLNKPETEKGKEIDVADSDEVENNQNNEAVVTDDILRIASRLGLVPEKFKSITSHFELSVLIREIVKKNLIQQITGKTIDPIATYAEHHKFALEPHTCVVRAWNAIAQLFKPDKPLTYALSEFDKPSQVNEDREKENIEKEGDDDRGGSGQNFDDDNQGQGRRVSVNLDNILNLDTREKEAVGAEPSRRNSVGSASASVEVKPEVDILSILDRRSENFEKEFEKSENIIDSIMPEGKSDSEALVKSWVSYIYLPIEDVEKEKRLDEGLAKLDETNQMALLSIGYQISKLREKKEALAEEKTPGVMEQTQADAKLFGDRLKKLVNENEGKLDSYAAIDEAAYLPFDERIYDEEFVRAIKNQNFEKQTGDTYNFMKKVGFVAITGVGAALAAAALIPAAPVAVGAPVIATWVWAASAAAAAGVLTGAGIIAKRYFSGGQAGGVGASANASNAEIPDLSNHQVSIIVSEQGQPEQLPGATEEKGGAEQLIKEEAKAGEPLEEAVTFAGGNAGVEVLKETIGDGAAEQFVEKNEAKVGEPVEEAVALEVVDETVVAEAEKIGEQKGVELEDEIASGEGLEKEGEKELDIEERDVRGEDEVSVGSESADTEVGEEALEFSKNRRALRELRKQDTADINKVLVASKNPAGKDIGLTRTNAGEVYDDMVKLKIYFAKYPTGKGISRQELRRFIENYGGETASSLYKFYSADPQKVKQIKENFAEFKKIEFALFRKK